MDHTHQLKQLGIEGEARRGRLGGRGGGGVVMPVVGLGRQWGLAQQQGQERCQQRGQESGR